AGCPDADVNRKLLRNLPGKTTLGQWVEITRQVTALQKQSKLAAYVPELAAFYFKPGKGTSLTDAGEVFDSLLCADRNDWGHRQMTWSPETYAEKFRQQKVLLDRLLTALDFVPPTEIDVTFSLKMGRGNPSSHPAGSPAEWEAPCPSTFPFPTP